MWGGMRNPIYKEHAQNLIYSRGLPKVKRIPDIGLFQEEQLDDAKMYIEKLTYIAKLFKQRQYGSLYSAHACRFPFSSLKSNKDFYSDLYLFFIHRGILVSHKTT